MCMKWTGWLLPHHIFAIDLRLLNDFWSFFSLCWHSNTFISYIHIYIYQITFDKLFAINPHHRNGWSGIKFPTFNQCLLVEIFVLRAKVCLPSPLFFHFISLQRNIISFGNSHHSLLFLHNQLLAFFYISYSCWCRSYFNTVDVISEIFYSSGASTTYKLAQESINEMLRQIDGVSKLLIFHWFDLRFFFNSIFLVPHF